MKKLKNSRPDDAQLPDMSVSSSKAERSLFEGATILSSEKDDQPFDAVENESESHGSDTGLWKNDVGNWWGPTVKLIDEKDTEAAYTARQAGINMQDLSRIAGLIKSLRERGQNRRLAVIPQKWRAELDNLESAFPNFAEVVHFLRHSFAVASLGNMVPRPSPILLNGPPGVGKTLFANRLAELLGTELVFVQMATAQSNAALSGSAEYWSNTKPGAVFTALTQGQFANPVFIVDEIEKASSNAFDPMASFYSLLESRSASQFRDESYPWLPSMDASFITWICTSNDASYLPEPILSRLRLFEIPEPDEQQARRIAKQIFNDVLDNLPAAASFIKLTPGATTNLLSMSPRQMRLSIQEAIGRAIYEGRRRVMARDIPVRDEEKMVEERRMGFLT